MAKPTQQTQLDIGLTPGDGEYNLRNMYRNTILEAFNRYPKMKAFQIAQILGLSERTLHRYLTAFNLREEVKIIRNEIHKR